MIVLLSIIWCASSVGFLVGWKTRDLVARRYWAAERAALVTLAELHGETR